jgi:DNA processing protein
VISPFSLGAKPERGNFPARNRIISGLSLGVAVIQATTPDSGSLITARLALEQGREVFAVPGEVGTKVSQATNALIKKGHAKLIENFADILEEILPQFDTSKIKSDLPEPPKRPAPKLDGEEKTVWENLEEAPSHIDIVARKCNLPVHRVAAALLQLELKGLVDQQPGKVFVKALR